MYCTVFYTEMVSSGIHNCDCLEIGFFLLVKNIKAHLSNFK